MARLEAAPPAVGAISSPPVPSVEPEPCSARSPGSRSASRSRRRRGNLRFMKRGAAGRARVARARRGSRPAFLALG